MLKTDEPLKISFLNLGGAFVLKYVLSFIFLMKCFPFVVAANLVGGYTVFQVKLKENAHSAYIGIF